MRAVFLIILSAFFFAFEGLTFVSAQPQALYFDHLTVEDGLSSNDVTRILQDRKGFIWIGTRDGLNRYDGYKTTIYKEDPNDPGSISHNWIMDIYEDREGVLWIGTFGGGLNRFDPETESFEHFLPDPNRPNSLSSIFVGAILEDREGILWIGTERGGLNRFDPATRSFKHYVHEPGNPGSLSDPANAVRKIYEDREGVLWIGTWGGGLNRFDKKTGTFTAFMPDPGLPANTILDIFEDSNGQLWIATEHSGLNLFDRKTGTFTRSANDPGKPGSIKSDQVSAVYEDRQGTLWVGTWGAGLHRYDRNTDTFTRIVPSRRRSHDQSDPNISAIYEDRTGMLWIGTPNGASRVDLEASAVSYYPLDTGEPGSLRPSDVRAVYADSEDDLWIGTRNSGLSRYDRSSGTFTHYRHSAAQSGSLSHNHVQALFEDSEGTVWVGTWGGGLNRFDRDRGTFTTYRHDANRPDQLHNNTVLSIYEDRQGILWIGTWDGLSRFDRKTGKFTRIRHTPAELGDLGHLEIWAIHEDAHGILWLGTRDGGLKRFDRNTGQFTSFVPDPADSTSIGHTTVWDIHEDASGNLWLATGGGGLNKLDPRTGRFTRKTRLNSNIPDNVVYGILEDEKGVLWLGTASGLSQFDPGTGRIRNFGPGNSLYAAEFRPGTTRRSTRGEFLFGYNEGVIGFFPEQVSQNRFPPSVIVLDVTIFDKTSGTNERVPVSIHFPNTQQIELAHDQNDLSFEFVGLHYSNPERNQYAYMLENYDSDWHDAGTQRTATYTNLDPGAYVFKVRAANSDGIWSEQHAAVHFMIRSPWWATWWFRLIAGIAAIGIAFGFVHLRVRRMKVINQVLETQVAERTKELEQAVEHLIKTQNQLVHAQKMSSLGQLTAGIAHEIKNPLNFVTNFALLSNDLIDELTERLHRRGYEHLEDIDMVLAELKNNMDRISQNGNRVDSIVRSMMLHARGTPGTRRPTDLHLLLDDYIKLAYHGMRARLRGFDITIEKHYDPELDTVEIVADEIGRVLVNLLDNAIYALLEKVRSNPEEIARNSYEPTLQISTRNLEKMVEIRIRDNGTGIPDEQLKKIFEPFYTTKPAGVGAGLGLSLSYNIIVDGHGGSLRVESEPGLYTEFIIELPKRAVASTRTVSQTIQTPG